MGWREGVGDKQGPQYSKHLFPRNCLFPLQGPRGEKEKGSCQPPLSANPFSKLLTYPALGFGRLKMKRLVSIPLSPLPWRPYKRGTSAVLACANTTWKQALGKLRVIPPPRHYLSRTHVRRVKNAITLGICSCKVSGEKWCEISHGKCWVLSSFGSWGNRSTEISPEVSRHFHGDFHRAVSGEISRQHFCMPCRDDISKRYCVIWGVSRTGPLSRPCEIEMHENHRNQIYPWPLDGLESRDSKSLANRIARFETYLKSET